MDRKALDRKTLICYSCGNIAPVSIFVFIGFYGMLFYTDLIGLPAHLTGDAFSIAFLLSAIANVVMGYVSDHTHWKIGRRRPYILMGTIPAGLLFFLLFTPPGHLSQSGLFWYLTTTASLLLLCLSIFETPYHALAPELTHDYTERIRLSAYRRSLEAVGEMMGVFALPIFLALKGLGLPVLASSETNCYMVVAMLIGLIGIVTGIVCFWGTWERKPEETRSTYNYWQGAVSVLRNKPFLILLIAFFLMVMADNIALSQLAYLFEHFYDKKQDEMGLVRVLFSIGTIASVPMWLALGRHWGKKITYIVAMICYAAILGVLVITHWSEYGLYLATFLGGFANAGMYMMPLALVPDIIEWDEQRTNERREGAYMGVWIFAFKIGLGLSLLLVGLVLELIGYRGGHMQSTQTIVGLRYSFGLVPAVFLLLTVIIFSWFPITKAKHEEILADLEHRRQHLLR